MTPQIRSRNLMLDEGFLVETVEKKKKFPAKDKSTCPSCGHKPLVEISVDCFGFADILAVHPQTKRILLVQATSGGNHTTRKNKILSTFEAKLCLMAGIEIWIQSWKLDTGINRWVVREEQVTLKDFQQAPHYPASVAQLREIRRKEKQQDFPEGTSLEFLELVPF